MSIWSILNKCLMCLEERSYMPTSRSAPFARIEQSFLVMLFLKMEWRLTRRKLKLSRNSQFPLMLLKSEVFMAWRPFIDAL